MLDGRTLLYNPISIFIINIFHEGPDKFVLCVVLDVKFRVFRRLKPFLGRVKELTSCTQVIITYLKINISVSEKLYLPDVVLGWVRYTTVARKISLDLLTFTIEGSWQLSWLENRLCGVILVNNIQFRLFCLFIEFNCVIHHQCRHFSSFNICFEIVNISVICRLIVRIKILCILAIFKIFLHGINAFL